MKQIFIDKFVVPKNAAAEFNERMNYNRSFIKKFYGFIKDTVYERTDEEGNKIIITVAEWEDELALVRAREKVQSEYKKIGFDPGEMTARLNIKMERGIFAEIKSPL